MAKQYLVYKNICKILCNAHSVLTNYKVGRYEKIKYY